MNRLIVTTALALSLCCGAAFAQQAPDAQQPQDGAPVTQGYHHHHAPNPQRQAAYLAQKLNLNPTQTQQVESVLATRDQQTQALWQNQQLTPQDRHQQMRAINEQARQQMATFLSPDQMAQLKAMQRERHHHGDKNGEQGPTSPSM